MPVDQRCSDACSVTRLQVDLCADVLGAGLEAGRSRRVSRRAKQFERGQVRAGCVSGRNRGTAAISARIAGGACQCGMGAGKATAGGV